MPDSVITTSTGSRLTFSALRTASTRLLALGAPAALRPRRMRESGTLNIVVRRCLPRNRHVALFK
jgi:hypothetical protein